MNTATLNYNEDYVLEMLLNDIDDEQSNFFGHRHQLKKQAKIDLKKRLKKRFGKGWWLPGKLQKFHKAYKETKHKVIDEALKKAAKENFDEREKKKEIKGERKDVRKEEQSQKEFEMQLKQQLVIQKVQEEQKKEEQKNKINLQNLEANKPKQKSETDTKPEADKKKKQTIMIAGGVGGLLLIGLILFLTLRNRN